MADANGGRGVIDLRQNDENAIGAPGARLSNLIGVEHEVLAQGRQRGGCARLRQEFGRALEGGRIGQDGEARRAAGLITIRVRFLAHDVFVAARAMRHHADQV